jgi:hypothetical protein
MKRRLLTLSPLLLSILPSQGLLYAMESTTILEKSVYLPHPTKTISILEELRQHPRFIKAQEDDQAQEEFKNILIELHETFGLNPDRVKELKEQGISLELPRVDTANNQEQLNLAISQLISGTIATDEETTTITKETPTKAGFNWTLRLKSFTHSAADLALYTLRSTMFEHDNSDHLSLLNQGILECVKAEENDKLLDIIITTKEKYAGKIVLADEIAQAAHQQLSLGEENRRATFIQNFAQLNAEKQALCKALIQNLQKQYSATIDQTLEIMNSLNNEYKLNKKEFRAQSYAHQKKMTALRQLSNPTITPVPKTIVWDEATQEHVATLRNVNLTLDALTQGQSAIKDLSHYLLLDNK